MNTNLLTAKQRETLHHLLVTKRAQLQNDLALFEEQKAEGIVDSVEIGDLAEGVVADRDRTALEEHDRALLGEVEHALAKLDAGTFGTSEASGRPIPFARLRAIPWARYDVGEALRVEHAAHH